MPSRDYYDILGITRSATSDDIRRAHRKLALAHHPDRSKAKDAPAKFAEIQQAYEVLSDTDKRKQYDEFVRLGGSTSAFTGSAPNGPSAAGAKWNPQGAGGASWNATDNQSFESIFGDIFGASRGARGARPQSARNAARAREQMQYDLHVPLETVLKGGKVEAIIDGTNYHIDIPQGIEEDDVVAIPGKMDAIARVHMSVHAWITRDERDLSFDLPISIVEATLGATIDAPLPATSGTIALKIPAGTSSGKKLRIAGRGFPASKGRPAGDLYVVIQVVAPKEISALTKQLLEEVGRAIDNPRARIAHLRP
jgi:DnaJ-class molecular chaperone